MTHILVRKICDDNRLFQNSQLVDKLKKDSLTDDQRGHFIYAVKTTKFKSPDHNILFEFYKESELKLIWDFLHQMINEEKTHEDFKSFIQSNLHFNMRMKLNINPETISGDGICALRSLFAYENALQGLPLTTSIYFILVITMYLWIAFPLIFQIYQKQLTFPSQISIMI